MEPEDILLTAEERQDPEKVRLVREYAADYIRQAVGHQQAHAIVADLVGATCELVGLDKEILGGTRFQTGVVAAAGPVWDQDYGPLGQYKISPPDARTMNESGLEWEFLFAIARVLLGRNTDEVKRRADLVMETRPTMFAASIDDEPE